MPIKVDELQTLKDALSIVKDKLMIDRDVMEVEDIESMTKTIRDLNWIISQRSHEEYKKQLQDFKDHMNHTIDNGLVDDDSIREKFYDLEFEVTFNDKSITLQNSATVFNFIFKAVEEELDELIADDTPIE